MCVYVCVCMCACVFVRGAAFDKAAKRDMVVDSAGNTYLVDVLMEVRSRASLFARHVISSATIMSAGVVLAVSVSVCACELTSDTPLMSLSPCVHVNNMSALLLSR